MKIDAGNTNDPRKSSATQPQIIQGWTIPFGISWLSRIGSP
ncbi:hypothetical protein PAMC26577_04860 [Caballeronia sordidicola]|uniref:Uncharacterized protein n=1 Tax=Caballeronia sordidicola TaxID=196367 RepID=A0A242N495_CABSO|nr:hypothetical protein PAMC26577_04860 [Caballeronia sordidicola]